MADRSVLFDGSNYSEVGERRRVPRPASANRTFGESAGGWGSPAGEAELFLLAVPPELRDRFCAQIAEFRQGIAKEREPADRNRLRFAGWELDMIERRLIAPGGFEVRLPGLEFSLLRAFVEHPRQLLSRAELANASAHGGRQHLSARTVDCYVCRLRRKLRRRGGATLISTVRTVGYTFAADVVPVRN
jgi:two-component system OmpR family response regulator